MFTTTIPYNVLEYLSHCGNMQELRVDANGYPHGHVIGENEQGTRGRDPAHIISSPNAPLSLFTVH
jgi:hypothetical protein